MIIVRTEIQCKWGEAQTVIERSIEGFAHLGNQVTSVKRTRILTDLSGPQDTVIIESEIESLDAYFATLEAVYSSPEFYALQESSVGEHPYLTAKKTFYTVETILE